MAAGAASALCPSVRSADGRAERRSEMHGMLYYTFHAAPTKPKPTPPRPSAFRASARVVQLLEYPFAPPDGKDGDKSGNARFEITP